jgi:outer membrane receptor protein involved in Fe transport
MTARGIPRAVVYLSALLLAGVAHAQPAEPPAATGTIAGQVVDAASGDPIIEAGVEVIGVTKQIRTDLDGRYSVKVPAGTYSVRFFAPLYEGARIEKVVVDAGKVATAAVPLKPQGQAGVEVVEVVAQAAKAAEATQLIKRQKAAVVSDNVGAETIKKAPDADAAEIVQRVPAVTIRDDKFIFVRGLGERYSSAVLDGSRLPSPDPERRVVPLDLFPAEFLESISVMKTYTPDLPGDFSAGLADIELLDFPDQLTYGLGLSTKGNANTTFRDFKSYDGDRHDLFGFGGDKRALPDVVPGRSVSSETPARRQLFGRSFPVIWETDEMTAPLDYKINGQIGDRFGPVGARLAFTYGSEWRRRVERQRQFLQSGSFDDPNPVVADDFEFERDELKTKLGAVLTTSYEITKNHRVSLRSLLDRNATDLVAIGEGITEQTKQQSQNTTMQYTQDELAFGQLAGEHHFDAVDIDWRTALSRTTQNIPDWRITNRVFQEGGRAVVSNDSAGGSRIFSDLTEKLTDSHLDFTVPFKTRLPFTDVWPGLPAKLKFGPAYAYRKRDSTLRQFKFAFQPSGIDIDPTADFNDVYAKANIGGSPPFPIVFDEITEPQNAFKATEETIAGYGMLEVPIIADTLRVIGGARAEYDYLQLDIEDIFEDERKVIKNHTDPMPGVNLVYTPRPDMNVRLAWSQTVSRPEFRELSPAIYPAPRGLRGFSGNPTLDQTDIESWDVRWEWFFGPSELVSLSGFYKTIDAPIEQSVFISGSAAFDTFQQNQDAKLYGFEFEGRKNLGTFSPWLEGLNFVANVSYVESDVTAVARPASETQTEVTRKRDLQGQAPFVVNAVLEYSNERFGTARLLYNTVGDTIARVQDRTALPDFIEKRRDSLDFVYLKKVNVFDVPLTVKLTVENMLNDKFLTTVGDVIQEDYRTGVTAGLGISYAY